MTPYPRIYKHYVLAILTLVCTLNSLDRTLMIILLEPIKDDLHLSDTQLGFLTGIAFGLFYATLGIPIARWADRGNRATIASLSIAVWGMTVMSCIWVTNFGRLVLARVAAAIGESGGMPPTYSLLGDYFPHSTERTRAMTVYWLASPLAALISFVGGGWLNERYGWRLAFFVVGVPALLIAPVFKLTVREPRLRAPSAPSKRLPRMTDTLASLWRQPSSRHLSIAIILLWTMGLGLAPWYAAFMERSHGMKTADLGLWMGLIFGIGGAVGILVGGHVTSRWFPSSDRAQLRLVAVITATLFPCFLAFLLVPSRAGALIAMLPMVLVFNFAAGPIFALMQRLVADEIRATTLAVVMLLANLIGMGAGPQAVGILSDLLTPALGQDALRYAMLIMSLLAFWTAYHFWRVSNTVAEDLAQSLRPESIVPPHRELMAPSISLSRDRA